MLQFLISEFRKKEKEKYFYALTIIGIVFILQVISCISMIKVVAIIMNSTSTLNFKRLLITHLVYSIVGFLILITLSFLSKKRIKQIVTLGVIISILLLVFLVFFGNNINGAKRWIKIAGISMQPSCLILSVFPYLNGRIISRGHRSKSFFFLCFFLALIILQPDFGSSIMLCSIWFSQAVFSGEIQYFGKQVLLIMGTFFFMLFMKGKYVLERIMSIFEKKQVFDQSFLALKCIKLSTFFQSPTSLYVPEMHNDYFLSALTNVSGTIVTIFCLLLWLILLQVGLFAIKKQTEREDKIIMLGFLILIATQSFLHTFTNLKLMPTKGTSFPFLSAGGTLILCNSIALGLFNSFL